MNISNIMSMNSGWFTISNKDLKQDEIKDIKDIKDINTNWREINEILPSILYKLDEIDKKNKEFEEKIQVSEKRIKELENICQEMKTENLKLINRILEAEISLERSKNLLLRKNISFPFTPLTNKML